MPAEERDQKKELMRVLQQLEDETQRAMSAHFLVGEKATMTYKALGVTATALAAVGSAAAFRDFPLASGIIGALVAALTAVITYLNLVEKTKLHSEAGRLYLDFFHRVRTYRQIDAPTDSATQLQHKLHEYEVERSHLNSHTPDLSGWALRRAPRMYGLNEPFRR